MIINLRGTSGSGKSTIFRNVLGGYNRLPQFVLGRRQPLYYLCASPAGHPDVMVLGHYETPCGECNTIAEQDTTFELIRQGHSLGKHVLFEGLLVSGEVVNTVQLHKDGLPLQVIALTTPVDLCIDSVNERRRRKNPDKAPVNPKNTVAKSRNVEGAMGRLKAAGVSTLKLDRAGAEAHIVEMLKRPL